MRLLLALTLLVCACAAAPASAAAPYAVTACFGAENASWSAAGASAYVGTAVSCPAGTVDAGGRASGEGLVVHSTPGRGTAPVGASGALVFDAPAGLVISGVELDARLSRNAGWEAGVQSGDGWLWCGASCTTTGGAWLHVARGGLASRRLALVVRCVAARCRRGSGWQAWVAVRNVRVWLEDAAAPVLSAVRGVPAGWARGRLTFGVDAVDTSGVAVVRTEVDGAVVHEDRRPCDFTRAVPCGPFSAGVGVDTRDLADGTHRVRVAVADAAGAWAAREFVLRVDNTAPGEPALRVDGGPGWSAARARVMRAVVAGTQAAPLARARVRVCRGSVCAVPVVGIGAGSAVRVDAFAGPGEYTARVALEDAAGNLGPWSLPVDFRFDDAAPGLPDLSAADGWLREAALPLRADAPLSGLQGFRVTVGSTVRSVGSSLGLAAFSEGATPVVVRAVSGAGVLSDAVRTVLRIDRSAPSISVGAALPPDAWSREPVRLVLRGSDQAALSGVASVRWRVDGGPETSAVGDEAVAEVSSDGRHVVAVRAVDGAGNASVERTVGLRVDRTAPETVVFEAPDPADPRRVAVVVADAVSGVARGVIELRPAGGAWRPLETTLADGRLVARIDDAVLPAGPYELRARAFDVAGNEAVGTRRADGSPVTVVLPVRARVELVAQRSGRTLDLVLRSTGRPLGGRPIALSQRLRGRRAWRPVCPRRTVIVASEAGLGSAASPGAASAESAVPACSVRTDARGRARIRLSAGPSRTVRAAFAGDDVLLPATARAAIRTRARLRLTAPPAARPGGTVRFRGRLLGGHLPAGGKVVELQARVDRRWRTFATVRTDRRGRVRRTHRFTPASSGRTYRFRLLARRESAYPFETGWSQTVAVRIL
jgi:hypothetical protein